MYDWGLYHEVMGGTAFWSERPPRTLGRSRVNHELAVSTVSVLCIYDSYHHCLVQGCAWRRFGDSSLGGKLF